MKLLFANSKTVYLREHKRLAIAPMLVVAAVSLPLWASSSSFIATSWFSLSSGITSSPPSVVFRPAVADGFALFSEAEKGTWQMLGGCGASDVNLGSVLPHHGGLIGAAIDPAFGCSGEVGTLTDYGYDTARDGVRYGSLAMAIIASWFFLVRLIASKKRGELTKMKIFGAVLSVVLLTATGYLMGTFIINNFGGLG